MYVLSQDKKELVKVEGIRVEGRTIQGRLSNSEIVLGKYSNEDRCIEIVKLVYHMISTMNKKDKLENGVRYHSNSVFVMPTK